MVNQVRISYPKRKVQSVRVTQRKILSPNTINYVLLALVFLIILIASSVDFNSITPR